MTYILHNSLLCVSRDVVWLCRIENALAKLVGGKDRGREPPQVDMQARMQELGLEAHLPETSWPTASAVRELAAKLAGLERKGVKGAFVVADLRK